MGGERKGGGKIWEMGFALHKKRRAVSRWVRRPFMLDAMVREKGRLTVLSLEWKAEKYLCAFKVFHAG